MSRYLITLILLCVYNGVPAQKTEPKEIYWQPPDSIPALYKKPWLAAVEVAGLNMGVWAFNRYLVRADYAYIDWNSMKRNICKGFVWDNDQFSTNLLAHPYHGGLYYNAARSNGMSMREASFYTVGGSLMWEFLMENELPSINDFVATPIGGICLGEITFRLSDLLIDSRTDGWERFGREFLTTLVSPVRGFNRILSGDAWKIRSTVGRSEKNSSVQFCIESGYRGLSESREIRIDHGMYVDFKLLYGNLFSAENEKPYDAFTLHSQFNLFSYQPVISNISIVGEIWGRNIPLKNKWMNLHWGVFQHFDYYDSKAFYKGEQINSYKISEAAAFGIGAQFKADLTKNTIFALGSYLNAVLLGGSITDYYRIIDRDYNIGSGFSSKLYMWLFAGTKISLGLGAEKYRFYTWKGYASGIDLAQLSSDEQANLNVQGDKGITDFTVSKLNFNYHFREHYLLSFETSYYLRDSHYRFFPDVKNKIIESRLGLGYIF